MKTDIVILGAGIGGYETYRQLKRRLDRHHINKKITIVDKNNYLTFVPMLHEAAAGSIEPQHCAIPLRELVHNTPHDFLKSCVKSIDPKNKRVVTDQETIDYDYCVVALGSGTNYYGIKGAEEYSYHVRSLTGAMNLHHNMIDLLEHPNTRQLAIAIVGGGYTGVEVAGQFADIVNDEICKLYPDIKASVSIIEGASALAGHMPKKIQDKLTTRLKQMKVAIYCGNSVKEVRKDTIILENKEKIPADITIWTAGFKNIADNFLPDEFTKRGRIPVTNHLTNKQNDHVYAVGDIMFLMEPNKEIPYPQLAEAAYHEGKFVAFDIVARYRKQKNTKSFVFKSKGTIMPVGNWYGILMIGKFILSGRIAWWIRRIIYLFFMPGFIRKLNILVDWILHGLGSRFIIEIDHHQRHK